MASIPTDFVYVLISYIALLFGFLFTEYLYYYYCCEQFVLKVSLICIIV